VKIRQMEREEKHPRNPLPAGDPPNRTTNSEKKSPLEKGGGGRPTEGAQLPPAVKTWPWKSLPEKKTDKETKPNLLCENICKKGSGMSERKPGPERKPRKRKG